jgi:acetyl esterase/lipase
MKPELRDRIRALGREVAPPLLEGTHGLFAELHARTTPPAAGVSRDLEYGPDERNRLDLWLPEGHRAGAKAPVLLFAHGGGFVMGDKSTPGTPFYDNVGRWAVAQGWIGATMTYRLAPAHPWPAGAEDVGRAVEWLAQHVAPHGGDPSRIFAMGQSAGAVHVGSYIAFPRFHGPRGPGLAGGLLISSVFDIAQADRNDFQKAYFGADDSRYAERSSLPGLVSARLPLLASVSEFDADEFYRQAALFVSTFMSTRGRYPRMLYLEGQNHVSSVLQIGLPEDNLGPHIADFVAAVSSGTAE